MCSFPGLRWVAFLVASLFWIGGDSQLTVEPGRIRTGGKVCPDTVVYFTCVAYNVRVLQWLRNGTEQIAQFTNQDMPSTEPEINDPFRIYLNSSDNDGQNNLNVTSTLVGPVSGFQSGDRIFCPDNAGDPFILNFTTTTPVPDGFQLSVSRDNTDDTLYLDIRWNSTFNMMYGIISYQIAASNEFINCLPSCNASSPLCRCSGLTAGMDGTINITATTCGDQQGLPAVVDLIPRVPDQVSSCSSYPVYNASNRLYRIETTWTQVPNPSELTSAVDQNILDYSVSFGEEATLANCSSSSCSLNVQPIASLSTVSVTARNVIGRGQERVCNLSPSVNSQTNDVFTITLSTTNVNRSVDCTRLMPEQSGVFSCQFCIEINNALTCYNLENSAGNSGANAALTDLGEGTYLYRITAFLNGVPVASISDVLSTACQLGELGATDGDGQTNSSCLSILNGRVCFNGTTAGSVATYSCDDGFTLTGSGSSQRTCRSDGLWEGDIPSCDATVPGWVIPLLVVSVLLWVTFIVEVVVSIPLVIVLEDKLSKIENQFVKALSYGLFIVEIILFLLIFILWMVFASDPKGVLGRNCVAAAFALSLVLVVVGLIDSIPVVFYLKSALFNAREECKPDNDDLDKEDPEKHQRHKVSGQKAH